MSVQNCTPENPFVGLAAFRRDCLFELLELGSATGLEMKQSLRESGYEGTLSPRLYQNLDYLDEHGYIDKDAREPDGRTNTYRLTDEGEAVVEQYRAWITEKSS